MKSAPLAENEEERIRLLHELNILDTLEEKAYDDLTYLAAKICDTPIALVSLVDSHRQWFKSHFGLDARETPRELAFCSHAILDDKTFIVEDSDKDERFFDNPLVTDKPHVKFYAGTPLVMSNKLRLGTLCVIGNSPRTITKDQRLALEALARQVVSQLELRLKVKELESLDEAKDEFISMVSHELRTPLTAIYGSLSLLSSNKLGQMNNEQHAMTENATRNSNRLLNIVNDILDNAKLEAGKLDIIREPHNIIAILEKAIELNKPYCEKCDCHIILKYNDHDSNKIINCDENRLLQVLTNLISNAAKASYNKGTVTVSLEIKDNCARIEVLNHGPGIPAEQQKFIFQKFKQIETSGNTKMPGTGLGLRISKQIVELHDGTIGFESVPNDYTKFYFTIAIENNPAK